MLGGKNPPTPETAPSFTALDLDRSFIDQGKGWCVCVRACLFRFFFVCLFRVCAVRADTVWVVILCCTQVAHLELSYFPAGPSQRPTGILASFVSTPTRRRCSASAPVFFPPWTSGSTRHATLFQSVWLFAMLPMCRLGHTRDSLLSSHTGSRAMPTVVKMTTRMKARSCWCTAPLGAGSRPCSPFSLSSLSRYGGNGGGDDAVGAYLTRACRRDREALHANPLPLSWCCVGLGGGWQLGPANHGQRRDQRGGRPDS